MIATLLKISLTTVYNAIPALLTPEQAKVRLGKQIDALAADPRPAPSPATTNCSPSDPGEKLKDRLDRSSVTGALANYMEGLSARSSLAPISARISTPAVAPQGPDEKGSR
jgi:hypothetical protein